MKWKQSPQIELSVGLRIPKRLLNTKGAWRKKKKKNYQIQKVPGGKKKKNIAIIEKLRIWQVWINQCLGVCV